MSLDLPVMLIIVLFLALGIFSQWLATQIKWPSIVVMSIVGLLIGPILGLVNPQETLGAEVFSPIVSLAVAVILFEGSSNLDFRELRARFLKRSFELLLLAQLYHGCSVRLHYIKF